MEFGDVITSFRKKKKIDQKELASALGVTVTYISLIENNRKKPSIHLLKSAADYFGVPVSVFLFNALKTQGLKNKKSMSTYNAAAPIIDKLVNLLISDKDESVKKRKPFNRNKGKIRKTKSNR